MFDLLKFCFFPKGGLAYPGRIVTLYGRGTLHSCGPTRLDKNKEYLLFGKMLISNTIAKKIRFILKDVIYKECFSYNNICLLCLIINTDNSVHNTGASICFMF